jgi:hypothetical protein
MRRDDLHAPGLVNLGFPVERLIQVRAHDEAEVLAVLEDALATVGVAAAIGEAETPDLKAGRRLQLACERRGSTGVLLRRRPYGGPVGKVREVSGSAAQTRWRIAAAPSQPPPATLAWVRRAGGSNSNAAGADVPAPGSSNKRRPPMARILSVWCRNWPITTWRRANPTFGASADVKASPRGGGDRAAVGGGREGRSSR